MKGIWLWIVRYVCNIYQVLGQIVHAFVNHFEKTSSHRYSNWQKSSVLEAMQVLDWCIPKVDFRILSMSTTSSMLTILIRDQSPDLLQAQIPAFSVTSPSLHASLQKLTLQFPWGWSSAVEDIYVIFIVCDTIIIVVLTMCKLTLLSMPLNVQ